MERFPELAGMLLDLLPALRLLRRTSTAACYDSSSCEIRFELPGYSMVREVGRGGMGVVFEACHLCMARKVAIKVLLNRDSPSPSEAARFQREGGADRPA